MPDKQIDTVKIRGLSRMIGKELASLIDETRELIIKLDLSEIRSIYRRLIELADAAQNLEKETAN